MFEPHTLRLPALLLAGCSLLLPAAIWPDYLNAIASVAAVAALMPVYGLHAAGVPGLLEHNGLCGWGWCSPTITGWLIVIMLWVGVAWLLAWGMMSLINRRKAH